MLSVEWSCRPWICMKRSSCYSTCTTKHTKPWNKYMAITDCIILQSLVLSVFSSPLTASISCFQSFGPSRSHGVYTYDITIRVRLSQCSCTAEMHAYLLEGDSMLTLVIFHTWFPRTVPAAVASTTTPLTRQQPLQWPLLQRRGTWGCSAFSRLQSYE